MHKPGTPNPATPILSTIAIVVIKEIPISETDNVIIEAYDLHAR